MYTKKGGTFNELSQCYRNSDLLSLLSSKFENMVKLLFGGWYCWWATYSTQLPRIKGFFLPGPWMNVEAIPVISRSNIDSECIWERRDRLNAEAAKREDAGRVRRVADQKRLGSMGM